MFVLLLFFQWKTTEKVSLTELSNDQQRVQQMRLKEYPPVKLTLFKKTIWIPAAHWFEGRVESIAFFRILANSSEVLDPNLYFFANHPRERVGVREFEKFPYLFFPLFIFGVYLLVKREKSKKVHISVLAPVILISLIGNNNPLGSISLFPYISLSIILGLEKMSEKLGLKSKLFMMGFLLLLVLVIIQTVSYEYF